ncbi:DUF4421 domain-containing protein [Chitinophaga sp. Cy-1792]|uniref:DUF4421 domain-containing protein n=1 Tax=Chitinophaga sp. Cy-1792 TaxID=2608339 RepID=UPI00141F3435|nr:DUF4421 domain-containing protein [Chitinophaga sp. Cy-1792]NIG53633.1 DUF4421 domain-containing protein [Chitinophaga sp. Cy-1792]
MVKRLLLIYCLFCLTAAPLAAQHKLFGWLKSEPDTAYLKDLTEDLTFRFYGSRKYSKYDIVDIKKKKDILYRPNSPFNIGFGANYKFIGLNLGFNFPFVNRHNDKYGKTNYLDLQSHVYLRKLVIDLYASVYKGFYVANAEQVYGKDYTSQNPYPQRPDMRNTTLGLNTQYIFNDKKFSYRAPNLQNEYQKKSAGSLIVGGDFFYVKVKGDSSLIPSNIADTGFLHDIHYYRTDIFSSTANVGYAYTLVIERHWFVSLSVTGGIGVNRTNLYLENGKVTRDFGWQINNTVRASIGYNSVKYFAGIHYVGNTNRSEMALPNTYQTFGAGNFRVSVVRRFVLKHQLF